MKPNCQTCKKYHGCELSSAICGEEYAPIDSAPLDSDGLDSESPYNPYNGCFNCKHELDNGTGCAVYPDQCKWEAKGVAQVIRPAGYSGRTLKYPKQLFSFRVWETAVERRLNVQIVWFGKRYKVTLAK